MDAIAVGTRCSLGLIADHLCYIISLRSHSSLFLLQLKPFCLLIKKKKLEVVLVKAESRLFSGHGKISMNMCIPFTTLRCCCLTNEAET